MKDLTCAGRFWIACWNACKGRPIEDLLHDAEELRNHGIVISKAQK